MGKTLIISAGHGGGAPGVCAHGYREADLAVWLRDAVALGLRNRGCTVLEDGPDGVNEGLGNALRLMRANPQAQAWEIHFNAPTPTARGVEVLSPVALKSDAQAVALAISNVLGTPLRGDKGWKAPNAGAHSRLAFCEAGGGIIEVEFLTNKAAIEHYLANRIQVAGAIAAVLAV